MHCSTRLSIRYIVNSIDHIFAKVNHVLNIFNMPMAGHMPVMLMLFNNRGIDNKRMENLVSEYAAFPVAGFCIAGPHIEALTLFSTELRPNLSFKNSTSHLYFYTRKEQLCERFAAGIKFTNKQTSSMTISFRLISIPSYCASFQDTSLIENVFIPNRN